MDNTKNNDIIEFLIECLVISKLAGSNTIPACSNKTKLFNRNFRNTINLSRKMIDIHLDKLVDIETMEKEYNNFDMVYAYKEN